MALWKPLSDIPTVKLISMFEHYKFLLMGRSMFISHDLQRHIHIILELTIDQVKDSLLTSCTLSLFRWFSKTSLYACKASDFHVQVRQLEL